MTSTSTPAAPARLTPAAVFGDPGRWRVEPYDRELFDRELRGFVPPDLFDAHAHWYDARMISPGSTADDFQGPPEVGYEAFVAQQAKWMGDRHATQGLFFPFPARQLDAAAANRFLLDELEAHPRCRGLMIIRPQDDPAAVEGQIKAHRERLAGFKVYHVFAERTDTQNAEAGEFLPEWAWELADRHGLWITLHLVLRRALADERNQRYVREHCLRYPGAHLVLAHAARGFCAQHTIDGIGSLRGLDNVYFDTSAVCESGAFEAIVRAFGVSRLMYGSDFGVSELRGRCVSVGDGFFWVYEDNARWEGWALGRPTLVGIESLLALRQACAALHLSDGDVERVFSTNARQLLRLDAPPRPGEGSGEALYVRAKQIIPGGVQLLSKRPEMFVPDRWPAYFREAHGCEVIDLDGRRYLDMSVNNVGACLLGYADPDVTAAVMQRVELGATTTLNSPEEVELAELLLQIHPWAGGVRYGRGGGEAMSIAVRIARAATRRDVVAICGYHGWADWYLAANLPRADAGGPSADRLRAHLLPGLDPAGVPAGLAGTALTFNYNRLDELERIVREHGPRLAAVVMEPTRSSHPDPGFLEGVRELCDRCGARLVFDEITVGWRLCLGGAHLNYGVTPDMAVFAKAMGNGHPIAAVIGNGETMEAAQGSFISSTYWTEGVGPAAALATIRKMQRLDVPAHVARIGTRMREGWQRLADAQGVKIKVSGHPPLSVMAFEHADAAAMTTLFTLRMLERGFLAGGAFYPTLAHEERHVEAYLAAADEAFAEISRAAASGDILKRVAGPVKHSGFARLA